MEFECVIFDCDGTLVDSESVQCELLAKHLSLLGVDTSSGELIDRYRGWRLSEIVSSLSQRHAVEFGAEFVDEFRAQELQALELSLTPMPGVRSALARIAGRKCVASSSPAPKIRCALNVTGLIGFFGDNLFSAHDIQKWKPDPSLFLYAAYRMGVPPERCVVVEDSAIGVRAALSAGMRVVHYVDGGAIAPEPGAAIMNSMDALPDLLSELCAR